MLTRPCNGWTTFEMGKIRIARISYICDPHIELCDALADYLTLTSEPVSAVQFDLEGNAAIVVLSTFGVTVIGPESEGNEIPTRTYDMSFDDIVSYAKDLVDDLTRDFRAWIEEWDYPDNEEERKRSSQILQERIDKLENAINKYSK